MLRIILGAVFIIVAYFIVSGGRSVLFYILWLVGLITGATWFCGLYKILGIDTCKIKKK
jgi:hypothetical protein